MICMVSFNKKLQSDDMWVQNGADNLKKVKMNTTTNNMVIYGKLRQKNINIKMYVSVCSVCKN